MIPYPYQSKLSIDAVEILRKYAMVYLAMEERTGKTFTALLIAEKVNTPNVLVITKKKALPGWEEHFEALDLKHNYELTNYHQVWKCTGSYDLVIIDEAHNYISSYPKIGANSTRLAELRRANKPNQNIYDNVKRVCKGKPIIYLSATPYAQGPQLLFHQFSISSWSPWTKHGNFYSWFKMFGKVYTIKVQGREINQYDKADSELILSSCEHLFISKTRTELGFEHEPTDELHTIRLSNKTMALYNELVEHQIVYLPGHKEPLVCDTVAKLRASMHMLEGGVAKIEDEYIILKNKEKIDFILQVFGDNEQLVIMYNYKAELTKLKAVFKKAELLQATSYAEGVDLHKYKNLVIYSQDFSTARHTQRRARQANKNRSTPITVHYLLVEKAISQQVYKTVSVNKKNFVDSVFEREHLI